MSILLLGPDRPGIIDFLTHWGEKVVRWELPLESDSSILDSTSFIISFGYRYLLKEEIICKFPCSIINLHISLLPWNRGADPNLWSLLEDTPKGVSIHYIDVGLDTGNILVQEEIEFLQEDTLRTSYERLTDSIEKLFYKHWDDIRNNRIVGHRQQGKGTSHRMIDKEPYMKLLTNGWDTPIQNLIGKAKI